MIQAALGLLLSPRVLGAIAVAGACWWGYNHVQGVGYDRAVAEYQPQVKALTEALTKERKERSDEQALAKARSEAADAEYRAREKALEEQVKQAGELYAKSQSENSVRLAAERERADRAVAAAGRLSDDLRRFAAGGSEAGGDSLTACSARAVALGSLLGETLAVGQRVLRRSAENAEAAESNADAVRALTSAWPVVDKPK